MKYRREALEGRSEIDILKRKSNEDARIIDALNAALDDKIKIQQENAQVINDLRMDLEKEKVIRFLRNKIK